MSSGKRVIVINPQERLVSADINRLQSFNARDDAELFRYMLDVTADDDLGAAGVVTEYSTTGTPLRAEVINGLLVRPQLASFDLAVDAGVLYAIAPDGDADSSVYKYVRDAGLPAGSLAITANASGSTRFDVVECQLDATPAVVTDTRDVFNTVNGTFSPTLLTKESAARLTYRVRAGTPGAGFPGAVAGWLPLMVAQVPTGVASNDGITFWDVRPLISDRRAQPFALSGLNDTLVSLDGEIRRVGALDVRLRGVVRAYFGDRKAGGMFRPGTTQADADYVNIADAANQDTATPIVEPFGNPQNVYLYLMFPFGLPRWARYTDASSGSRAPRSPRGILLASLTPPTHFTNAPSAGIGLPGFGVTSTAGVCVGNATTTSGDVFAHVTMRERKVRPYIPNRWETNAAYNSGTGQTSFTLPSSAVNEIVPRNAKYAVFLITGSFNVSANTGIDGSSTVALYQGATTADPYAYQDLPRLILSNQTAGVQTRNYAAIVRVPMPCLYPAGSPTVGRLIVWQLPAGLTQNSNPVLRLIEIEL